MKATFPASDMLAAICPVDRDDSDRIAQYASPGQWQVLAVARRRPFPPMQMCQKCARDRPEGHTRSITRRVILQFHSRPRMKLVGLEGLEPSTKGL